jgi:hypothetical protein
MKVIVAAGIRSFDLDEVERLGSLLAAAIGEQGHDVELMQLEADAGHPARLIDQATAIRSLRVDRGDRLVAVGWPSHLLWHDHKIVLLTQRNICGGWHGSLPAPDRDLLLAQEVQAFTEARRCFALSEIAAASAGRVCDRTFELLALPVSIERPHAPPLRDPGTKLDWRGTVSILLS